MNTWLDSTVNNYIHYFGKTTSPVVYDVGSRDGHDGVELAERISNTQNFWKEAQVILFECNPPQIEVIKDNYPWATLITEAISDKSGQTVDFMQIHGDKNMVGSSTLNTKRDDEWIQNTSIVKVKTKRLDEVIKELGHDEIDIMKVDIEGYTFEALQSLGKYLRSVKVYHLETEIEGYARNKTNVDVAIYMQDNGYRMVANDSEWAPNILDQIWVRICQTL